MKRMLVILCLTLVSAFFFSSTADARQVFVPSQYVNGVGFVPGHWVAVPDNYPAYGGNNLMNSIIRDRQQRANGWSNFANAMNHWAEQNRRFRAQRQERRRQLEQEINSYHTAEPPSPR